MTKKTQKLIELLRGEYPHPNCAFIPEVLASTGSINPSRADAIAMFLWPSEELELKGFEVKTSRADWLKELQQPDKAEPIKQFCDRWYLVVDDEGIVRWEEIPSDWGFMYVDYMGKLQVKKEAPKLDPKPISRYFLASLLRLASKPLDEVIINNRKYKAIN